MQDSEMKVILGILYDHVRHLHVKVHEMELVALSVKDTLSLLNPSKQAEGLYKDIYNRRAASTKADFDAVIASIDADMQDLEPPSSDAVH